MDDPTANWDSTFDFCFKKHIFWKFRKKCQTEWNACRIPCVWHSCSDSSCMGFVWHSYMCMAFSCVWHSVWHFMHPKFVEMNFVLGAFFSMLQINLGIFPPSFSLIHVYLIFPKFWCFKRNSGDLTGISTKWCDTERPRTSTVDFVEVFVS